MIFVTVGGQMPFDRLVRAADLWAQCRKRTDVFAQIGTTRLRPQHIEWVNRLDPHAFQEKIRASDLVVAHAGMGSILAALECGRPILVMPRRGDWGETRNDHQVATARWMVERGWVEVAYTEEQITRKLDEPGVWRGRERIGPYASAELLSALSGFINEGKAHSHPRRLCLFTRLSGPTRHS